MLLRSTDGVTRLELAFVRLRYSLEGDRPSQTNKDAGSPSRFLSIESRSGKARDRKVFHRRFPVERPENSLLFYTNLQPPPVHPFSKGA